MPETGRLFRPDSGSSTSRGCSHEASVPVSAAVAMTTAEVFPADPPVAVLSGALAVGSAPYDAVIAEHVPVAAGTGAARRSATAVAVVAAAQLVAVEAALGAPDPLPRRAARVLLAPAGLAVHGVGGAIGAVDAAAGRVRPGKTERA